jgi:transposase
MSRCRWTVNQGIAHFNSTSRFNAIDACDEFVTQFPRIEKGEEQIIPFWMFDTRPKWIFNTPKVYRYNILRKLSSNIKSAFSNLKAKNIKHFKFRFRGKRKNDVNHLECDEIDWSIKTSPNGNVFISMPGGLTNLKVKIPKSDRKKGLSIEKAGGLTLRRDNNGWYVDIMYKITPPGLHDQKRICALDPGQRSFLSGFDLQGNSFQLGMDVQAGLRKLKFKRNLAQSQYDKLKKQNHRSYKEYKMFARAKRAFYLATNKISDYIKQLHYHSCKYLTENYDKIIIPVYGTQKMVKPGCNKWNDMILSLNHFAFRSLLIARCEVLRKTVIVCTEEYTSVTCGQCSSHKMDLGASKVYKCSHCNYKADRDENAAFNILRFVINSALPVLSIE